MLPRQRLACNLRVQSQGVAGSVLMMPSSVTLNEAPYQDSGTSKNTAASSAVRDNRTSAPTRGFKFARLNYQLWDPSQEIVFTESPLTSISNPVHKPKRPTGTFSASLNISRGGGLHAFPPAERIDAKGLDYGRVGQGQHSQIQNANLGDLRTLSIEEKTEQPIGHKKRESRGPHSEKTLRKMDTGIQVVAKPRNPQETNGRPDLTTREMEGLARKYNDIFLSDASLLLQTLVDFKRLPKMFEKLITRIISGGIPRRVLSLVNRKIDNEVPPGNQHISLQTSKSLTTNLTSREAQANEDSIVRPMPFVKPTRYTRVMRPEQNTFQTVSPAVKTQPPALSGQQSKVGEPSSRPQGRQLPSGKAPRSQGPASSVPGGLNLQPSPKLRYPDLSLSDLDADPKPLYTQPEVLLDTCVLGEMEPPAGNDDHDETIPDEQPFRTPHGFHIPDSKLKHTVDAEPFRIAAFWQHTLYRGPGGDKHMVKVHYCKTKDHTEREAQHFLNEKVLGFDIEWKPQAKASEGIRKNVALIQLASEERIALFHIARYPKGDTIEDLVAPTLKKIMESPDITKVGVAVKGDCTRLRNFMEIKAQGLFELSHLYKLIKYSPEDSKKVNKKLVALATQVEEHLKLPLWKGEVRSSDWSSDLSYAQIQYAASDSYAGFQLYHMLESKRQLLDPTPPRPAHAELNLPIRLANGRTVATVDAEPEGKDEDNAEMPSDCPVSIEELARDFINIAIEDTAQEITGSVISKGPPTKTPRRNSPSPSRKPPSTSATLAKPSIKTQSSTAPDMDLSELEVAKRWTNNYITAVGQIRKLQPSLRQLQAYALWYEQNLAIPHIARLLRKPPLVKGTVIAYICEAIRLEGLPYDASRLEGLTQLGWIPYTVHQKKLLAAAKEESGEAREIEQWWRRRNPNGKQ